MKLLVNIETLSPLHIGSGVELLVNYDYTALEDGSATIVFNQDAIYANELAQRGAKADLAQPAASLLKDVENLPATFIRYTLNGQAKLERLNEQMKDVYGGVYLPGSSLKGAIRNTLMTYAASRRELSAKSLATNSKEAAQYWEREIFGDSPWSDILRALHVTDSHSVNPPPLEVLPVRVFVSSQDDEGSPIEVEAISAGTTFETSINLDELTLQYANDHRLDWTDRLPLLANLLPILQMVGKRRIESELLIARERGFQQVIEFYEDLQSKTEGIEYNHSALIQIGWGTGWKGMTIGEVLDKPVVDYLRQRYDLGKPPTWNRNEKGPWQANFGKPFPKSHRFSGGKSPQNPLGWVKISLTPYGKPRINDVWEMIQKMADEGIEPMQQFASVRDIAITITSKPAQPEASAIPFDITWMFSPERLPQPGDKFDSVLSTDGETFIVSLMGLDPDTEAYGELGKSDNPELPNLADGQLIRVEVLAVEKNRYGVLCVRCRLLQILRNRN